MSAVTFHGHGAVWHPVRNRVFARFVDGVYTTSDPDEIAILAKTFPYDGELPAHDAADESITDEPEEAVTGEPAKRPRGRPRNA